MAKSSAKRRHDEAERTFRRAWKLLDRIERRLERARAEEAKRVRQLGDGTGPDAARRAAQLEAARSEISQIEGLLTELSELISSNARASAGQTVKDMAASVAAEIRDEAAEPPTLSTPSQRRNRHHRPRRRPAGEAASSAEESVAAEPASPPAEPADEASADAGAGSAEDVPKRRNRHHRPRRRHADAAGAEPADVEDAPDDGRESSNIAPAAAVIGDEVDEDEVGIVVPKRRNRHHRPRRAAAAAPSAEPTPEPSAAPAASSGPSEESVAAIPLPPPSLGESVPRAVEPATEPPPEPAATAPVAEPAAGEPPASSSPEPPQSRWIGGAPGAGDGLGSAAAGAPEAGSRTQDQPGADGSVEASGSSRATPTTGDGWTASHARARAVEFGSISEPSENREA